MSFLSKRKSIGKSGPSEAILSSMVGGMPIATMLCELEDFKIVYVNQATIDGLESIKDVLPIAPKDIVGQSIDIFHKNPAHQRALLADPSNLPHQARINVGGEILDLLVTAIYHKKAYIGPMVTWSVVTKEAKRDKEVENLLRVSNKFESSVGEVIGTVKGAVSELETNADSMLANAERSEGQASIVVAAAEELRSSIEEIARQTAQSATIADNAVSHASSCTNLMSALQDSAKKIEEVVTLIQEIAAKTNLLALNATIEAARAGEQGRGFAVVANEVKGLANQTAGATENIVQRVGEMQESTQSAVSAIDAIGTIIREMQETSAAISAAIEEQGAATSEVSKNMVGVSDAAVETNAIASNVRSSATELSDRSAELSDQVGDFLNEVRAM